MTIYAFIGLTVAWTAASSVALRFIFSAHHRFLSRYTEHLLLSRLIGIILLTLNIAVSLIYIFGYRVPTTGEYFLGGFACTENLLSIPELSRNCPFLSLDVLASASYDAHYFWTTQSIGVVKVIFFLAVFAATTSLATIVAFRIARYAQLMEVNPSLHRKLSNNLLSFRRPHRVFISYRRVDSQLIAQKISEALSQTDNIFVFFDLESLVPGDRFTNAIELAIERSDVFIAIIGSNWDTGGTGERRIEDPNDIVRQEVELALSQRMPIIPVRVESGTATCLENLPVSVSGITRHNFFDFHDVNINTNVRRLVYHIRNDWLRERNSK